MSDEANDRADKVGYRSPPRHSRFKPGQSGNPKGRPKGVRNFKTDLEATLSARVQVTQDGKPRRLTTQEAALLRLRDKALRGDARALDRLLSLAQAYNMEESTTQIALSAADAELVEVFKARVLSGAADHPADSGPATLVAPQADEKA